MPIELPIDFIESMKSLLKNEYPEFEASYEKERFAGLRFNPLKASKEHFDANRPCELTPVPWAEEGFYYPITERPGKSPLHDAGAYYIQEPSAMSAVAVLDPKPGDYVADLCAAPGGKSTQIAGRLSDEGLLVSNEYVKDRARILSQNIERMGVRNAVVLNENTDKLASRFHSFFDKVLVDAPCSGEGMFRKEELAVSEWSHDHVVMCAERQLGILENAAEMLKPGGILVYSTCTFNPLENEGTISKFLSEHPEFSIDESPVAVYFSPGHPEWADNPAEKLEHSMRLWPHKLNGEGHFVCRLKKEGIKTDSEAKFTLSKEQIKLRNEIEDFLRDELSMNPELIRRLIDRTIPLCFGDNLYLCPKELGSLTGLNVERPGLHVAVRKKNRLEPAHSLAMALTPGSLGSEYSLNDAEAEKYLRGETVNCDLTFKSWTLMTYKGYSIGFGKAAQGIIKNHYPKGLRRF